MVGSQGLWEYVTKQEKKTIFILSHQNICSVGEINESFSGWLKEQRARIIKTG